MKDSAIIAGIFTIIGVTLGAFITYFFSIKISKRQEFNKAASSFRKAFTKEIRLLSSPYTEGNEIAIDIIRKAIVRHENAAILFRDYLGSKNIPCFNKAWSKYSEPNKYKVPSEAFIEYDSLGNKEKEDNIRMCIIHRINELLKFAKVK